MAITDASLTSLRVFREVAERGTLTAAAATLGYTQSAVSRQIAALERAAGTRLLHRRRDGVSLTPAGRVVLRRVSVILDELGATARELGGLPAEPATVRLGWFASAGASLVPAALGALRRSDPAITVIGREAGTPGLVRALRAGTIDLALVASAPPFRPLETAVGPEAPALVVEILTERYLAVAVSARHRLARQDYIDVADLRGERWIAGQGDDLALGVWPGLADRPIIAHTVRDWYAKLQLVAADCGITTVPSVLTGVLPHGVRVLPVRGGSTELRRLMLARLSGPVPDSGAGPVERVAAALRTAALETDAEPIAAGRSPEGRMDR